MAIKSIQRFLDRVEDASNRAQDAAAVVASKRAEAIMKRRIFRNRRDRVGRSLGPYNSEFWKKQRQRRGRQTREKDLFFLGNLFRSLITGKSQRGNPAFGFSRERFRMIAEGQEKQINTVIFLFSRGELKEIMKAYKDEYREQLRREVRGAGRAN